MDKISALNRPESPPDPQTLKYKSLRIASFSVVALIRAIATTANSSAISTHAITLDECYDGGILSRYSSRSKRLHETLMRYGTQL